MSFKKFLIAFVLSFAIGFTITSCTTDRERYAAKQFKNISEVVLATKDATSPLDKDVALTVIGEVAKTAAKVLDPDNEIKPTSTAAAIAARPQEEIQKILEDAHNGPTGSSWFNWATILGGAAIAAGVVGRILGPPFNIAGNIIQFTASKFVPNYDKTKVAATGLIASTEKMLADYAELLDTMPEVKAKLKDKLKGADPVEWMKENLRKTQVDLGTHNEVAEIIKMMKNELTTKNGVLTPTVAEIDKFISKKI